MAIEIDPFEAVIKLAQADSGLSTATGGRIAMQYRIGQDSGDWPQDSPSLILLPAGGQPAEGASQVAIEARAYGPTPAAAAGLLVALLAWADPDQGRRVATIGAQAAVVYHVLAQGQPALAYDENIDLLPFYRVILSAQVAHEYP